MLPKPFDIFSDKHCQAFTKKKGEALFRQGDETLGIWFVNSGQISLRRVTATGAILNIYQAHKGGLFAEASLFSTHYHCDAICLENSKVTRVHKSAVLHLLQNDADFALNFSQLLAEQVQSYRMRLEILAIHNAQERVLAALEAGLSYGNLTELAAQICLSRETVYRVFNKLVAQGMITKKGRGTYSLA